MFLNRRLHGNLKKKLETFQVWVKGEIKFGKIRTMKAITLIRCLSATKLLSTVPIQLLEN